VAAARSANGDEVPGVLVRAERFIARESWLDMDRVSGVRALGLLDVPGTRESILRVLGSSRGRFARVAAAEAIAARSRGREAETAAALVPLLDDDDLFMRIAIVRVLASLGDAAAIPALEARLAVEMESRVINVITGAIARLRTRE
jgi:HEAT repeat protein